MDGGKDVAAYGPRGAARELFMARDHELLLEGPAGTGKSRAVLEKVFLCAQKYAGMRALLARKTRASMSQSVLVTLHDKVLPPGHRLQGGPSRSYRQSYLLSNGSEIVIGGLDNADRIMSTEYDLIAVFEATEATEEDWEKLTSRLRNGAMPYQQAIADCNPGPPGHWLNTRAKGGHMRRLRSMHEDNPLFWDPPTQAWTPLGARYIATLDRLSGVRHQRLRLGQWAAAEGLVYPTLLEHVLAEAPDAEPLPSPSVRVAAGLDWGFTDPVAVAVGALCEDGRIYVADELYETQMTLDDLRPRLRALQRKWAIETFFCDISRPEMITALRRHDLPCLANQVKAIDAGIAMVERRLRAGYLKIAARCRNLLREAGEYQYQTGRDGHARARPEDCCNHGMDALRYLIGGMDRNSVLNFSDESLPPVESEPSPETLLRLGHPPAAPAIAAERAAQEEDARRYQMAWGP